MAFQPNGFQPTGFQQGAPPPGQGGDGPWWTALGASPFGGAANAPFSQQDWPVAAGWRQTGGVLVAQSLLVTTLAVATLAAPFAQKQWDNPARARHVQQVDQAPNLLTGALVTGGAKPFRQTDWPSPSRAKNGQQDAAPLNLLARYLPIAAKLADQPNPPLRRSQAATEQAPNLLLRAAVVTVPPLRPVDLTTAPAVRQAQQPGHYRPTPDAGTTPPLDPLPYLLAVAKDFPNPTLRVRTVQTQHHRPTPDAGAPAVLAPIPYPLSVAKDFPNPTLRTPQTRVDNAPNLLLEALGKRLVAFSDSENPGAARRWQQPEITPNLVIRTGIAQFAPFRQGDWQPPVIGRKVQQPDALPNLVLRGIVIPPAPFRQADWQNPVRIPVRLEPQQFGSWRLATSFPPASRWQTDWQNPTLARKVQQPDPVSNLLIRGIVAPLRPFNQRDWQNPTLHAWAARATQDLHVGWINSLIPNVRPSAESINEGITDGRTIVYPARCETIDAGERTYTLTLEWRCYTIGAGERDYTITRPMGFWEITEI